MVNGLLSTFEALSANFYQSIDITEADLDLLRSDAIWTSESRKKAKRTIDELMYGAMDIAGLPQFTVPAEYTASVIAGYVNPANWTIACHMCQSGAVTAEDAESGRESEPVTPKQLLALVMQVKSDNITKFTEQMEKKTRRNIAKVDETTADVVTRKGKAA